MDGINRFTLPHGITGEDRGQVPERGTKRKGSACGTPLAFPFCVAAIYYLFFAPFLGPLLAVAIIVLLLLKISHGASAVAPIPPRISISLPLRCRKPGRPLLLTTLLAWAEFLFSPRPNCMKSTCSVHGVKSPVAHRKWFADLRFPDDPELVLDSNHRPKILPPLPTNRSKACLNR